MIATLTLCLGLALPVPLADIEADRAALLAGIETLERHGVPGTLCVYGDDAFAVLTGNKNPEPVVAAARHGKGRVVAIAHGSYLSGSAVTNAKGATSRLIANALSWTADRKGPLRVAVLGRDAKLAESLRKAGHEVTLGATLPAKPVPHVLVWQSGEADAAEQARIADFVKKGGGLLAAHCPWGYEQVNARRGLTLRENLPENRVLKDMGLVLAAGYADATERGKYAVAKSRPDDAHAGRALRAIVKGEKGSGKLAYLVEKAIRNVPDDETTFRPRLEKALRGVQSEAAPAPKNPLGQREALVRLAVTTRSEEWRALDPDDVGAFPGADGFPGVVPRSAKRTTTELVLDPAVRGWQSTGLYLAPGEVLTIRRTSTTTGAAAKGPAAKGAATNGADWRVRIGCHKDRLWAKPVWKRWPEITHTVELVDGTTRVATPWGGSVYFETTRDDAQRTTVSVAGAVAAPRYVLGDEASAASWNESRRAPGPWAELEARHIVLSVPSSVIRKLDDPAPILEWWDRVLTSHCKLACTPLPERRERFVPDVQISAGYMHAGYPMMTHLDVVQPKDGRALPPILDLEVRVKEGGWGYFHELGHNRQRKVWTFDGTGEVTVNLFSLFSHETICGITPWEHSWLGNQKGTALKALRSGKGFPDLGAGGRLVMYAQLQKAFGWEPFQRVFTEWEAVGQDAWPKPNQDRIDQWMLRMSAATGHDLRAFFDLWKLPLSDAARNDEATAKLSPWMPDLADLEK